MGYQESYIKNTKGTFEDFFADIKNLGNSHYEDLMVEIVRKIEIIEDITYIDLHEGQGIIAKGEKYIYITGERAYQRQHALEELFGAEIVKNYEPLVTYTESMPSDIIFNKELNKAKHTIL